MIDTDANSEEDPGRLDNDDIQDIQASTFQYGVTKTQQQLMAENPHMNGDMYAEATIGEEEVDDNHNGIPDDEEDRVGTFLRESVEGVMEELSSTDLDQREMDDAFSASDRDLNDPSSKLHHAVEYVQQQAGMDPEAQALLDNYNNSTDAVQSALDSSRQSHDANNFLALKVAELNRSIAKSDIVKYESGIHGESDELARAQKWHDAAQSMRDKLAEIQKLPPDQQQAALDKMAQNDPHSRIAGEWSKFKTGDLAKWEKQDNRHLAADGPDYTVSDYQPASVSESSPTGSLSSIFGNWAMPWSSSQSLPTTNSMTAADATKTESGWSLSSIFGNWAMPWSSSQPASLTAGNTVADEKNADNGWSLTSIFSSLSMPGSTPNAPASSDPQRQAAPAPGKLALGT